MKPGIRSFASRTVPAALLTLALILAASSCDLLLGVNNFTVKIVNHTGATVTVWWSDLDEASGKTVSPNSTSATYPVRTDFKPLDFRFYVRPAGGTAASRAYVIGDGWNYTLGVYTTGSSYYLSMDNEVR